MSEKRSAKASKPDTLAVVDKKSRKPASSPKKKGKAGAGASDSTIIKVLYGAAIVLAIAACAVIGVKTYDDLTAEKSANTLLNAYKELQTAEPTATPLVTPTPEPTATPTPDPDATPAVTPGENYDDTANEHRVEAENDLEVDETGNYVQPADAELSETEAIIQKIVASVGDDGVIGTLEIPSTGQEYPIIGKWSYKLLNISICRYTGGQPNEEGKNLVLIGHNYTSGAHFGNLKKLKVGDEMLLTGRNGDTVRYVIYDIEGIAPDDFEALEKWRGDSGLTLLTCKDNGNNRLIVRCERKAATVSTATSGTLAQ